jgi:hypothetical protein
MGRESGQSLFRILSGRDEFGVYMKRVHRLLAARIARIR